MNIIIVVLITLIVVFKNLVSHYCNHYYYYFHTTIHESIKVKLPQDKIAKLTRFRALALRQSESLANLNNISQTKKLIAVDQLSVISFIRDQR